MQITVGAREEEGKEGLHERKGGIDNELGFDHFKFEMPEGPL